MSEWLPSLNALRAFEAVSRHLSYQLAAKELHVTPAAVMQLVQKLEASLDTQLVKRQGRGIALTDAGLEGANDLSLGFKRLHEGVSKIRKTQDRSSLTITAEPSFAITWLVKRIDAFKRIHSDIDVLVDSSSRIIDLHREPTDIAIRYAVKAHDDLISHRMFDDETLAVCSPSVAEGPPVLENLKQLENVPLIHMNMSGPEWSSPAYRNLFDWQSWFENVGAADIKPGRGIRFNEYSLAIQAAIAGHGVVLGSLPLVVDAIEAGLLVSPFEERAKANIGYDIVTTRQALKNPNVEAFLEWILAEIEN
ncbi:MAG: LysR substrate-binding domain-containing protein [Pseudomonadota bacterium]